MKKFLLSILIVLITALPVSAEFFSDIIVTSPDGLWTDERAYATLADAITAVGANERTIIVASTETVTGLTIPENVTLKFQRGGNIANSGTLTFQTTNIEADAVQIFTGTGDIDFANGTVVKSSWFSNFCEAVDQTNNDYTTLLVTEKSYVTKDSALGDNVILKSESYGNRIVANTGFTLSNIKNIECPDFQLFAGSGDFDFLDGTRLKLSWFNRLRSVLDWVETEQVTIVVSGSQSIDYNETADDNEYFDLKSENGMFNIQPGITLTINSPEHILASPRQQIKTGTGDLAFTNGGTVYPEWAGLNTTPGTTDMTDEFEEAASWLPSTGGTVHIPSGTYVLNDWNPSDYVNYGGDGWTNTILKGTTSHIITIESTRANSWKFSVVSDLRFLPYNSGTYACIYTEPSGKAVANVTFRNVWFYGPGKYACYGYFNIVTWDNCWFGSQSDTEKFISAIYLGGTGSAPHANRILNCRIYRCTGPAINIVAPSGTYAQNGIIRDTIFEDLDDIPIHLEYGWDWQIMHNYFEDVCQVSGTENCIVNIVTCIGAINIDYNHFTGSALNNVDQVIVLDNSNPRVTFNHNGLGTVWNNIEIIDQLRAQYRFWFIGNYYSGTPTFGASASYGYYNDYTASNRREEFSQPGSTTLAKQLYNGIVNNLGQAGGAGATLTLTLATAAEGYDFYASLVEIPVTAWYIKAGASDKIYLDGTALDDGDKVGNLNATAAIGDTIHFWTFETAAGVYDWWAETISGTWTDEGP